MDSLLNRSAEDILHSIHHDYALKVGETLIRITECEYYPWDDVYTHRHPRQNSVGKIYIHRSSNKVDSGYKGGSYKGMDITLNGGILIRSIETDDDRVEGPSNVVDHISSLSGWSLSEMEENIEIITHSWDDDYVVYGARVGLTLKRADDLLSWAKSLILPYRSSIYIPSKHRETFFVIHIDREDMKAPAKSWVQQYKKGKESTSIDKEMSLLEVAGYLSTL